MFDSRGFHSWSDILLGACVFALMFALMAAMGEAFFEGRIQASRVSVGLGVGAFIGYVGVGALLRRDVRT